jgi:hypothetical protein
MRSTVSALVGKMDGWIAEMKDEQKETMACQVMMKTCQDSKEPNLEDMESEVERREVPAEEAAMKSSGAMKKRHGGRHLAAGRSGEPKELTRAVYGSRRRLAAASRKASRRAAVAWRKRNNVTNNWTKDKVERGTRRVRTLRKRLRTRQEGRMGIKDLGGRRPLCLRNPMERTRGNCGSLKDKDDPPCKSGKAKETLASETRKRQYCTENPERDGRPGRNAGRARNAKSE